MASEATSTEHSSSGSLNFIACSNFVTEVKQEGSYQNFVTLKEKKRKQSEAGLKRRLSVWVLFNFFVYLAVLIYNIYPLNLYGSEKKL